MFPGVPKMRDLEPVFNATGDDWIRISATNWLIWTDKPTGQLLGQLLPYLDQQDNVLVAAVSENDFFGRQPTWVWEWLRDKGTVVTGTDPNTALLNALHKFGSPT
jgi:hypothetical protein